MNMNKTDRVDIKDLYNIMLEMGEGIGKINALFRQNEYINQTVPDPESFYMVGC